MTDKVIPAAAITNHAVFRKSHHILTKHSLR